MAKLLLVEDDNNLREIYEARLQAEGYNIVSARDGEEALVVAKAEKPDLIISDVMMPKISGFEMLDILRNTEEVKNVKVIMLTALGQTDDQQRADRLGADRYLVKSQVTLEDIVKVAHELLGDDGAGGGEPPAAPPTTPTTPAAPAEPTPPVSLPTAGPADPPAVMPAEPPEPATEPTLAQPPAVAAPVPAATDSVAQSAAQEEAEMEAKIEDFVAGASSEPTLPAESPTATEAEAVETFTAGADPAAAPAVEPTLPAADQSPESTLATPAAAPTAPSIETSTASSVGIATSGSAEPPHIDTAGLVEPPSAESGPEKRPEVDEGTVSIANKKVIKPLDNPEKKDIHTLLALEEVAEKAKQGPPPPTAIIATDQEGPASVPLTVPTTPANGADSADDAAQAAQANQANATIPSAQATQTGEAKPETDPNSIAL